MRKNKAQSGFTLIEILVVISIIGMISTVAVTAVATARTKARDAKRRADLAQLQKGLELYFNTNGVYPCTGTGGSCTAGVEWIAATGNCGGAVYGYSGASGYIPNLAPTFVSLLPADPRPSTGTCSGYNYRSDGSNYKVISNSVSGIGGPESFPDSTQGFYDPARPTTGIMITNSVINTSTCPSATTCW